MKKINAVDLDNTLLPYDSMNRLVLKLAKVPGLSARILVYSVLRKAGLISRKKFFSLVVGLLRGMKDYAEFIDAFTGQLFSDLRGDVLKLVRENSDGLTVNILCTASPSDYAVKLAGKLGWDCVCSRMESGAVMHVYGETKKALVLEKYPASDYVYNFAISDSKSDLGLLKMFNRHELI